MCVGSTVIFCSVLCDYCCTEIRLQVCYKLKKTTSYSDRNLWFSKNLFSPTVVASIKEIDLQVSYVLLSKHLQYLQSSLRFMQFLVFFYLSLNNDPIAQAFAIVLQVFAL